jgi:hypothetical protein
VPEKATSLRPARPEACRFRSVAHACYCAAMSADRFRRIALSFAGAVEASHMGHPDFRVGRRVFATLGYPDQSWGMVKLTPEQQGMVVDAEPEIFRPVQGGWGRRGATNVRLAAADDTTLKSALAFAWGNVAPKSAAKRARRG